VLARQYGDVDVAAADHRAPGVGVEVGRPGTTVTVGLPALMRSESTSSPASWSDERCRPPAHVALCTGPNHDDEQLDEAKECPGGSEDGGQLAIVEHRVKRRFRR
jgi:hypothetical protein